MAVKIQQKMIKRIADKTAELLEDYYFKRGMMSAHNPELGPKQSENCP